MLYLHDVWVNWFEGEENGYNICPFHEWRKEGDQIILLNQVPLLFVEKDFFNFVENHLLDLPEQLLNEIYNKTYIRKNRERVPIDYCFIITNGKDSLAVDTIGYKIPFKKSRLHPNEEMNILQLIEHAHPVSYPFMTEKKEYHILSPSPKTMIGLTRKEREQKKLLFMALDKLFRSESTAEVRYWYTEWNPGKYKEIQKMNFYQAWRNLFLEVQKGWGKKHIHLCEKLIKGEEYFEHLSRIINK